MTSPARRLNASRQGVLEACVVRSLDDYMKAVALRSLVFMSDQHCPYAEEFDGNDLTANHVLVLCDGEPVATCRIRWFADFAKVERSCIHPDHRSVRMLRTLIGATLEYCRRKGYRKAITYTQAHRTRHWQAFGFRLRKHRPPFCFSDYEYVEFETDLEPHPEALTTEASAWMLNRPEGAWDQPSVLEISASRGGGRNRSEP